MRNSLLFTLFLLAFVLTGVSSEALAAGPKSMVDSSACLDCHDDLVSAEDFVASAHGGNGCTSCHLSGMQLDKHMEGEADIDDVKCDRCHTKVMAEYIDSVHFTNEVSCTSCHTDIHRTPDVDKRASVTICVECHDDMDGFMNSIHGESLLAGNADAPDCSSCHGLHEIQEIKPGTSNEGKLFYSSTCIPCHDNHDMMERNGVNPNAVETYLESYHGKGYMLGFPDQNAGCADCHTAHNVLPEANPKSTINEANIQGVCQQCHPDASEFFSMYYAHGDHSDSEKYPILYWTFMGMSGLLIGTFTFFWIHSLLWMFRGFVENREKKKALIEGRAHIDPDAHKVYSRFKMRHILLHVTVIISFLGLSLTGLPLKFSDQVWAKTLMSFYGGVHYAGLIHRGCAILTFYYFLGALWMSIDFLFIRKDVKGHFLQKLFGPDSLMPNLRDISDIIGMVKWFFFKGPKPSFERWTYWEKFDFLAVFWGMFAIGGSGLMLWFPEFFGHFLPGWMLNVATIIHSDEALLATGFIFTVHFFNTHGRPEKFPMDFVIFNGEVSKEELMEERGDQWKRYEELGITENFLMEKQSSVLYDFIFKGFGFLAVFTGLVLIFCMFIAFFA
ncbi:MAG: cytochrome C [Desulfuromonas sp.]|nr:MAG: cytochrome C [Desulfuromonas sp.]